MNTRKTIRRATPSAARRAMQAHIKKMLAKGWKVEGEFEGDAGIKFECIANFSK